MNRICVRAAGTAIAIVLVCGCSRLDVSGGGDLTFTLTADRTSAPVDSDIVFNYDAAGTYLNGVILDYGDGVLDSIPTSGAQSASGRRTHAFGAEGRYQVIGSAEDATQGSLSRQISVEITAAATSVR